MKRYQQREEPPEIIERRAWSVISIALIALKSCHSEPLPVQICAS